MREEKRERIYRRYQEAKENHETGNVKAGDIKDLRADFEIEPGAKAEIYWKRICLNWDV